MSKPKRVSLAAGGTCGHLFPAQALASSLQEKFPDIECEFMAAGLKEHKHFDREKFSFCQVQAAGLSSNPFKLLANCIKLGFGTLQSIWHLKKFKPDLVVGFGSNHAFPPLLAAKFLNIPIILHESNSIPGKVNRFFSKNALFTAIFFPKAAKHISGAHKLVLNPLKKELMPEFQPTYDEAIEYYQLSKDKKTLLVFGGSQGALRLNELMLLACSSIGKDIQIIHFTGNAELSNVCMKRYQELGIQAYVKDFETKMQYAWKAASFFIGRSGAGTISEQLAFQVPGIFIPYPTAADNHQEINARFIVEEVQGGLLLKQKGLEAENLIDAINKLQDVETFERMQINLQRYADKMKHEAQDFSELVAGYLN